MNDLQHLISKTFADRPDLLAAVLAANTETPEETEARERADEARRRGEQREMLRERRRKNSGLRGDQFTHTFAAFKFAGDAGQRASQKQTRDRCFEWAQTYPKVEHGLMLFGANGVGKDYLLHCIINRLLERGVWDIRYWYSLDYDHALRQEWQDQEREGLSVEQLARECDLLMIGDLHILLAKAYQPTVRASAMRLINAASDEGRPVMCATSNWAQNDFDDECLLSAGSRVAKAFEWYELRGPDRRRM